MGRNLRFVCKRTAKFLIVYRYWHWCIIVLDRTMTEHLCRNKLQMIKGKVIEQTGYSYVICFWKSSTVRSEVISRQECSLTLWSRNQHIAWFYVFRVLLRRVSCVASKHLPKENFTSFWRSFLQKFTYVIFGILNYGTWWTKRFSLPTFFCNGREHIAFSQGQKLLSNQFLHNLHFTELKESMKELTLVRFP